jgi:hypothetical protein
MVATSEIKAIENVVIVGSGLMGSQLAQVLFYSKHDSLEDPIAF